jgi:hypothetical protein
MAVPVNQDELLEAIIINFDKLKKELLSIPAELTSLKELEGHSKGTLMCIKNLVAYLVGWGELVLKWNYKKEHNEAVDFPETGYKWNELGKLAQKFYKDYEDDSFEELLLKLDNTVTSILSLIKSKSNHDLYKISWYEKWTLGRMIQFNTASPYTNARGRIRKWKKERDEKINNDGL